MDKLQQYKCPNCNASISFDAGSQQMKCPYCDTQIEVQVLIDIEKTKQEAVDNMDWNKTSEEWSQSDQEITGYSCESCGAQIIVEEEMAADKCPYCDNNIVISEKFAGMLKPNFIIPFKIDKEKAKNGLKEHIKGKKFLPKTFKDENHIDEIKGVYVPFWLFDCKANADIQYNAQEILVWEEGEYEYTQTDTYSIKRKGDVEFELIPVDASESMEDDLMESIEPYDKKEMIDFETFYLSGFLAEKYSVEIDDSIERANQRVKESVEAAFARTVEGYTTVTPVSSSVEVLNGNVSYALYPVWILNTKFNGENFRFAMNGQTGKFIGDLPLDKNAYRTWLVGVGAILSVILYFIVTLVHKFIM